MMDKNKYLDKLGKRLYKLPLGELGKVLQEYEKHFDDAGEDNEQDVIGELGSYKELAARIEGEYFSKDEYFLDDIVREEKQSGSNLRMFILILTFYIWIPLILVAYIFEALLLICGVVSLFGGLFIIVTGIVALFSSIPTGIFFIGTGMVIIALGILVFLAGVVLLKLTGKAIAYIFGKNKRGDDYE